MKKIYRHYPYVQSEEQRQRQTRYHEVIVVGGGMVGLTAALELARRNVSVVLLDDNDTVSIGSRGICHAKRSLEIWDRIGCAESLLEKGVSWSVGKVFYRHQLAYQFNLLPEDGHKMPAMINLQQYYVEEILVNMIGQQNKIDLRWKHKVTKVESRKDHVRVTVETPDGVFNMEAGWLLACDGANSQIRHQLGVQLTGRAFEDHFLIADVCMKADFPAERRFWFDPPFHSGESSLLHKQADNIWRIDFQLGPNADKIEEQKPENVTPRIKAMLGDNHEFELEWVSIYRFSCRRAERFRHQRILLAGDAAHQMSPFGARGGNSGIQDVDNLCWKLQLVINGEAPPGLIDTYDEERSLAADDNLLKSARATDFMSPKSRSNRCFRDSILELAEEYAFARPLVNSGRLSTPSVYPDSSLNTPQSPADGLVAPGTHCPDAAIAIDGQQGWLLNQLSDGFTLLLTADEPATKALPKALDLRTLVCGKDFQDTTGFFRERYGGHNQEKAAVYLVRPDQYVVACWDNLDYTAVVSALAKAKGHNVG